MGKVRIKDKNFELYIPEETIRGRVHAVARQISADMDGKCPLLLGVLNGAFIFAADLIREMSISCEISFVKLASYQGTTSTGKVKEIIGVNEDLRGRTVIIVEDVVESGHTMRQMAESLGTRAPASVHVCTLLLKPGHEDFPFEIEYVGFKVPKDFVVGYGFDYDGEGRQLRDIYRLVPDGSADVAER